MPNDPIVEDVRQARAKIFDECGGSLDKLFERLKAREQQHPERIKSPEAFQQERYQTTDEHQDSARVAEDSAEYKKAKRDN